MLSNQTLYYKSKCIRIEHLKISSRSPKQFMDGIENLYLGCDARKLVFGVCDQVYIRLKPAWPATKTIWASARQNLSSGCPTKRDSNHTHQLQRPARKFLKILAASLDMILSNKGITKMLIRLRGCAGWSAFFVVSKHRRQVSCIEAHIELET